MDDESVGSLVVPVALNGIYVEKSQSIMDSMADFSRLPWSDGEQDFNSDTPFLGKSVLSTPFQNKHFNLARGVHLHWILPRAHRTYDAGKDEGQAKSPPAAPNRWLINRKGDQKQWIVESDYLGEQPFNPDAVTVPSTNLGTRNQPYLYLGRQLELSQWSPATSQKAYWESLGHGPLSAFGYGELSFNTFYPNCRSVFGFFDPDPGNISAGITYEVVGWYADPDQDILQTTLTALKQALAQPTQQKRLLQLMLDDDGKCPAWLSNCIQQASNDSTWPAWAPRVVDNYANLRAILLSDDTKNLNFLSALDGGNYLDQCLGFGLQRALRFSFDGVTKCPVQSVYSASITIYGQEGAAPVFEKVAMGHSGVEALAAYLSEALDPGQDQQAIETQLNTLLLGLQSQNHAVDMDLNMEEARHNHGFVASDSGRIWRIRKMPVTKPQKTSASPASPQEEATLPAHIASLLDTLNVAQANYDHGLAEIEARKQQLYNDWCKYMEACYPPLGTGQNLPDTDLIRSYVAWESEQLTDYMNQVGEPPAVSSEITTVKAPASLAATVQSALDQLKAALAPFAQGLAKAGYQYELSQVPTPRYYHPKEPVVLFVAQADALPEASQVDELLVTCASMSTLAVPTTSAEAGVFLNAVQGLVQGQKAFVGGTTGWSPFMLQWLVEFFAQTDDTQPNPGASDYSNTYVTDNNAIGSNAFDFTPKKGSAFSTSAMEYSGVTYTSTQTKGHLTEALKAFLIQRYPLALTEQNFEDKYPTLFKNEHYSSQKQDYTNAGYTAWKSHQWLTDKLILSQSLGGFHDALLQQTQNLNLPIADPLGFADGQAVTKQVSEQLAGLQLAAPMPDNRFLPLRAGRLNLMKLAFVDPFGRGTEVSVSDPVLAASMQAGDTVNGAWLSPRLIPKTRLNFRWMAAGTAEEVEMNAHPATSPVCGWLLPNYFDHSLLVYAADGTGLGLFSQQGSTIEWSAFPASKSPIHAIDPDLKTVNPHLLSVLLEIQHQNQLKSFVGNLSEAQATIAPEYYAGQDALAMLMGKPIAVVRARLSLETSQGTLHDQGWIPFQKELQGGSPDSRAYEAIQIPVRLGHYAQLNDGLMAYWTGVPGGQNEVNWVNKSTSSEWFDLTLSSDPETLTMLMDPEGMVHATCGLLPVKTIRIPDEQYTAALKKIEVIFQIQPLLTPTAEMHLSLPDEAGYDWSWLEKTGFAFTELTQRSTGMTPFKTDARFYPQQQLLEGWLALKVSDDESAKTD